MNVLCWAPAGRRFPLVEVWLVLTSFHVEIHLCVFEPRLVKPLWSLRDDLQDDFGRIQCVTGLLEREEVMEQYKKAVCSAVPVEMSWSDSGSDWPMRIPSIYKAWRAGRVYHMQNLHIF